MEILEIVLILLGIVVFVGSFLLPAGRNVENLESAKVIEESVREMVGKEVDGVRSQISDMVNETINYSVEKTERSMERLTNEKMLAVNEYSDTVLEEINKNHQEVVFLYDMLNNKHESLTATVGEAARVAGEVKQTAMDAEIAARETEDKVRQVKNSMDETLGAVAKMQEMVSSALEEAEKIPAKEILAQEIPVQDMPAQAVMPEAEPSLPEEADFQPITAKRVEIISPIPQEYSQEMDTPFYDMPGELSSEGDNGQEEPGFSADAISPMPVATPGKGESSSYTGGEGARNNNDKILSLHKIGKSNIAIARELGLGVGEVKLVIDLYEGNQGIRVKDDELKILS